ncbi:MAG TPA: ABC transporter permease [Cyclobacteriaceae bacterium]|nr:ABC transporter permease [Cyclobacteriaceae bacterium]
MLRNYFKVAIRTFIKSKSFSLINIAGLSIGISTCILITLFVLDEVSFDRFHDKADRIYRMTELLHLPTEDRHQTVTSPPMAPAMERVFPEVMKTVRLSFSSRNLSYKDVRFNDTRILYADSTLLQIFSFPMIAGDANKALVEPYSVVLTERAAKRYFGNEDPINKTMGLSDTIALTVTGVIKDIPANSHLQFDAVMSRSTITKMINNQPEDNWFNNGTYSYMLLPEGYDIHQLEAKIPAFFDKEMGDDRKATGLWYDFIFQPLTSIHLHATSLSDIGINGNIRYVYTFIVIAILVLLIACANYINLATAKSVNRAKELGMRKVIGARKNQLVAQLLGESFLITLMAFIVAAAIVSAAIPSFNLLTGKQVDIGILMRPDVLTVVLSIFIMISLLAGGYPALLMSSVSPLKAMKDYGRQGNASNMVRKGLVIFQFTMSIVLISATMLIFRQMDYMRTRNLGLHKDQVLQVELPGRMQSKYKVVRDELSKTPGVISASVSDFSFRDRPSNVAVLPEGAAENEITSEASIGIDADFLSNFDIKLVAGRNFITGNLADDSSSFIVNETAVKHFNWGTPETAIGKTLDWGLGKQGQVVGVVQDFNFTSLHTSINPLIMHVYPAWYTNVSLRVEGDIRSVVSQVETRWKQLDPEGQFKYTFLDQDFDKLYQAEEQTRTIVGLLASLAIFIACLGLFGLAAFIAEQRTKEIGIRKVLGANTGGIIALMSVDFLKPILISFVIAVPIAWYAGSQWLTGFAFRTDIAWWIFGVAGLSATAIALLTVSFQSVKASLMNPVKALRTE